METPDSDSGWLDARLRPDRLFRLLLLAHLAVFTLLPWGLYANLPLDCIEMHSWGQQWAWGYHKHPPLPAWIARGVAILTDHSAGALYLAASACIAASFWAAWRLGRAMMSASAALIGVALLEGSYYFNFEAMNLNNNTVLYPFWALSVLAFYHAVREGTVKYWLALGACVGLGLLTKYTMAILPVVMLGFLLLNRRARAAWNSPGPYVAASVGMLIFLPHLVWAVEYDFPTLQYAMQRAATSPSPLGRLRFPLEFVAAQYLALLPMTLVAIPITGIRWRLRQVAPAERFDRAFLASMVFGPFVTILLISALLNVRLHCMWGSHLWTFSGVLLVFALKLDFRSGQQRRVLIGCAMAALLYVGATIGRIELGAVMGYVHREYFPGEKLAERIEEVWHDHRDGPLPIVAGEGWLVGNIGFYAPSHPKVYGIHKWVVPPTDRHLRHWIDDEDLAWHGGLFVWDAARQPTMPNQMRRRIPSIEPAGALTVSRRSHPRLPPLRIGVAYIPPRMRLARQEAGAVSAE
ncbi:MAG: glycosyltransferase family 39 protein [Pirellulales bacterium]